MYINKEGIQKYKEIFSYTEDLNEFKSRMPFEEWEKTYLCFDGNEADDLFGFAFPLRTSPSFTKDKNNWFKNILNQELFESNPKETFWKGMSFNSQHAQWNCHDETYEKWKKHFDLMFSIRKQYQDVEKFLENLHKFRQEKVFEFPYEFPDDFHSRRGNYYLN